MRSITLALALLCAHTLAVAADPLLTARAGLVMDAATGEVLWERNATLPLPPASTTKVMTAILAAESGRLDESLRVSSTASQVSPSKINLRPGQRMQLRNLVYAVLLNSANDAAIVVAEGLGGSQAGFAAQMNSRAEELGAKTAHFTNPHGLTAPGHVASARDLGLIFRQALRVPLLREILGTRTIRVPVEASRVQWISLRSHNRLLVGHTYPVIGKTGYTRAARRCFVGAATQDDRELIIVVLGSSDLWGDARRLFAHGFGSGAERSPVLTAAGALPNQRALAVPEPPSSEGDDEAPADVERPARARYTVQLGPYGSRKTALTTRAKLAKRGYSANVSGRGLRLGSFSSRRRALRLATRLRATGYNATVVAMR
jgi:D-alanyl-D-alanine carboxypeptidase (penicillin-binding protein 5/6)